MDFGKLESPEHAAAAIAAAALAPRGPEADRPLSEVMSPSYSAPPHVQQQLDSQLIQLALEEVPPGGSQVVIERTTITRTSGADVEAPDAPTSVASRKRSALSTDLATGGEPKRSSSPTTLHRPPLIPGQPSSSALPVPAGSPSS